jgi:glycosyltransferase involved in cell wall biosynthesis
VTSLQDEVPSDFDEIRTNPLGLSGHSSNAVKFLIAIKRVLKYKYSKESNEAKIHFCMDPSSLFVSYFSNLLKGHTFISSCHTPKELLVVSDRLIIKFLYHRTKLVIVQTETIKRDLMSINPKANIQVVPNPITFSEISCCWPEDSSALKNYVLYLGRFSPEKGVGMLPKLASLNPDISFVLVGSGPLQSSLELEKKRYSIDNLQVLGWADSRKYLQNCSLLILPSIHESFGLVVIESWAYGKPVIAAQVASGPSHLLHKHGGGSLVSSYEDMSEWGELIRENLNNELSGEFISKIIETYSIENILNTWLDLSEKSF